MTPEEIQAALEAALKPITDRLDAIEGKSGDSTADPAAALSRRRGASTAFSRKVAELTRMGVKRPYQAAVVKYPELYNAHRADPRN